MSFRTLALLAMLAAAGQAQLSTDQRQADFRNMGDLYARRYAAIPWKQSLFQFDPLNLAPWMSRINSLTNDLDFYDLTVEYVSGLVDAHDQYYLPSDYEAHLGFTVDIYDGVVLIDSVDRDVLSADGFPFQPGDQLISLDGQPAADLVKFFSRYVSGGNPRTIQRLAAELITDRYQEEYPRAHQVGDTASVVIQRVNGPTETYTVPWQKSGTALTELGPRPSPHVTATPAVRTPIYQQMLAAWRNYRLPGRVNVVGYDEPAPVFYLPTNFVQRLGKHSYDSYSSGTHQAADGTRIGYLRIPDFMYPSLAALDKEVRFFQANTDVLVVDVMRNPGGDVCSAEDILTRFAPSGFRGAFAQYRVDWSDIIGVNASLADARNYEADDDTIALLAMYQQAFPDAFQNHGGTTASLPICSSTGQRDAAAAVYTKPLLVLIDEMSASSADVFAAMAQDNKLATLFGYRTMVAGGSPEADYVGVYSEGYTTVTRSLVVRSVPLVTTDYSTTSYIENLGVRPDIVQDYMTAGDLLHDGLPFVNAFTNAAVNLVAR